MTAVRRRLRVCAVVWLSVQATSLLAMAPRECCAPHRKLHQASEPDCHTKARAPAPHCPMRAADGSPCPMHRARAEHDRAPASDCALRGTCGADAALGALLWQQGVLAEPTLTPPDLQAGAMEPAAPVDVHGLVTPPDSPPSWERGRGDPVVRAIAGSGSSRAMREIES